MSAPNEQRLDSTKNQLTQLQLNDRRSLTAPPTTTFLSYS